MSFEADVDARLRHLLKTGRMWGSPEELEAAALHLVHVRLAAKPGIDHPFQMTLERWRAAGGPFAADPDEHRLMREKLWGTAAAQAVAQVVQGYAVVWASLDRVPERERLVAPWLESVLDDPSLAGQADTLNSVLFTLMGFVAADPQAFLTRLNLERFRIGGHVLRGLHVVGPPGPSEAALGYGRNFASFPAVIDGLSAVLAKLPPCA